MAATYVTSRGLLLNLGGRTEADVVVVSNGEVQALYDKFVNTSGDCSPDPTIINDTIELVSRVFVGKKYTILNNVHQAGKLTDFIDDTMVFINGGTRKLSIHTWDMYIDTPTENEVYNEIRNPFCKTTTFMLTRKDVINWIQREGGIFDMLCVMHVLFN